MLYPIHSAGLLVLAAGQSKRLGKPKQLLEFEGQSLVNRLLGILKKSTTYPIGLVLGANADLIYQQLTDKNLYIINNTNWQEGMASSIRLGIQAMMENFPELDGLMILVCDQPHISENQIKSLFDIQREKDLPIAASYYSGVVGTPVVFHHSIFKDLLSLKGDIGAKSVIQQREKEVARLDFEKGMIDIDKPEDYEQLISGDSNDY